jgi:hypothetical protein
MLGQVLTLGTLVALTQAKAIITNNCTDTLYLWSVPGRNGVAENLPLTSGKRYEEPWRYGTSVNPGIAIKISSEENGIYEGKPEMNLHYTVDPSDSSKIWVSVDVVRGHPQQSVVFTCQGPRTLPWIATQQCSSTDDVEIILCGTQRAFPPQQQKTSPDDCTYTAGKHHSPAITNS